MFERRIEAPAPSSPAPVPVALTQATSALVPAGAGAAPGPVPSSGTAARMVKQDTTLGDIRMGLGLASTFVSSLRTISALAGQTAWAATGLGGQILGGIPIIGMAYSLAMGIYSAVNPADSHDPYMDLMGLARNYRELLENLKAQSKAIEALEQELKQPGKPQTPEMQAKIRAQIDATQRRMADTALRIYAHEQGMVKLSRQLTTMFLPLANATPGQLLTSAAPPANNNPSPVTYTPSGSTSVSVSGYNAAGDPAEDPWQAWFEPFPDWTGDPQAAAAMARAVPTPAVAPSKAATPEPKTSWLTWLLLLPAGALAWLIFRKKGK